VKRGVGGVGGLWSRRGCGGDIIALMGCNEAALPVPTADLVRTACREFDQENQLVEEALGDLFHQYPANNNLPHVLLKVVALNGLYAAQILAVEEVARHIHRQAPEIDAALHAGSLVIVDTIAKVAIKGKLRNNYSFATKYCSWHRPESYPIWDLRVDRCLWCLQQQYHFAPSLKANVELRDYLKLHVVLTDFEEAYGLGGFTFKEIDKFLWTYGGKV
jgi:hypothetical protein